MLRQRMTSARLDCSLSLLLCDAGSTFSVDGIPPLQRRLPAVEDAQSAQTPFLPMVDFVPGLVLTSRASARVIAVYLTKCRNKPRSRPIPICKESVVTTAPVPNLKYSSFPDFRYLDSLNLKSRTPLIMPTTSQNGIETRNPRRFGRTPKLPLSNVLDEPPVICIIANTG